MKRLFCFLIIAILAITPIYSFASDTAYSIDEAQIRISLPDTMYVFDRSTSPDDARITSLGLTHEALMSSFTTQDIYLNAMDTDSFNEILVICEPTDEPNYFDIGYDALYNTVLTEEKALTDSGRTLVGADIFEADGVDFIKTISTLDDAQIQYTTVYNDKKIKIKLVDLDGTLEPGQDESFEQIVESVSFLAPAKKEQPNDTPTLATTEEDNSENDNTQNTEGTFYDKLTDGIGRKILIIAVAAIICTIPALIFRFIFAGRGLKKKGAKAFTLFYTIAMTALFYFILTKHSDMNLSLLLCIVPVLWSFVIYKIIKK